MPDSMLQINRMNPKVTSMTKLTTILVLALGSVGGIPSAMAAQQPGTGYFDGVVGDHAFLVNVNCSDLEQDYFRFLSDRTDAADSNGDGVIISGMQNGDKFVLTVINNGETFSTGRLENFKKNANGATGSGRLYQDNSTAYLETHFTVVCKR